MAEANGERALHVARTEARGRGWGGGRCHTHLNRSQKNYQEDSTMPRGIRPHDSITSNQAPLLALKITI